MRGLVILGTAAMLAGGFLPWVSAEWNAGFGAGAQMAFKPFDAIAEAWERFRFDMPREIAVLAASFVLAVLALITALVGAANRGAAILAGALPIGWLGWQIWRADGRLGEFGLGLGDLRGGIDRILPLVQEVAAPGLYAYWFGALVTLLAGLGLLILGRR